MAITDLKPSPYNPRKISETAKAGLAASLKKFGLVLPIVWNKRTGFIVGGHQRVDVLKDMGEKEAEVIIVELDDENEKALNLTLNNYMIAGDFTPEVGALLEEIRQMMPKEYEALRLDDLVEDLGRMIQKALPEEVEEDQAPPLPATPITKPGDLWKMGRHRLLCGDSTSITDVEKLMGDDKADLVFTDPPYGVSFGTKNHNPKAKKWEAIANDELTGEKLYDFCVEWVSCLIKAAKEAAPVYVWTSCMEEGFTILKALKDGGIHIQGQILWVKNVMTLGQADYQWRHEICWYGWTEGKNHYWAGGRDQTTIWEEKKIGNTSYVHPTQKPVQLAARAIPNSCPAGGVVLDLFSGSGSTLMACEPLGRVFRGMEFSPQYCDVIIKRFETATGLKATL